MCMISLHVHIVVPQTDQTRRAARPRPHIPPSRCTACPCRTQAIWRRMRRRGSLQAGKDKWARGDPRPSHARTDRCGKRGPEAEARGTETDRETRGIEVERNTHGTKARGAKTRSCNLNSRPGLYGRDDRRRLHIPHFTGVWPTRAACATVCGDSPAQARHSLFQSPPRRLRGITPHTQRRAGPTFSDCRGRERWRGAKLGSGRGLRRV